MLRRNIELAIVYAKRSECVGDHIWEGKELEFIQRIYKFCQQLSFGRSQITDIKIYFFFYLLFFLCHHDYLFYCLFDIFPSISYHCDNLDSYLFFLSYNHLFYYLFFHFSILTYGDSCIGLPFNN